MVHLISVNLILVYIFLVHTLFFKLLFHGSLDTHGLPKGNKLVNHGSHVVHAPFFVIFFAKKLSFIKSKMVFFNVLETF